MDTSIPIPSDDQQTPDSTEQVDNFFRLSKDNLYQELLTLEREDESFRQVFGTFLGRRAKAKYEQENQSLRLENEAIQRRADQLEINGMTEEQINRRYNDDPEFARKYTELRHGTDNIQNRRDNLNYLSMMGRMFAEAEQAGVPPELIDQVEKDRLSGKYDEDDGRQITIVEAIPLMQRDLMNGLRSSFSSKAEVKPSERVETPVVSPKLGQITPDTSSAKSKSSQNYSGLTKDKLSKMTQDEVDAIPMETLDRIMAT